MYCPGVRYRLVTGRCPLPQLLSFNIHHSRVYRLRDKGPQLDEEMISTNYHKITVYPKKNVMVIQNYSYINSSISCDPLKPAKEVHLL